jgi:ATP-dependent Lon protease
LPCRWNKRKILAAKRANIKYSLSLKTKSDIDEIKPEYVQGLTFHYVKEMSEVPNCNYRSKSQNARKTL